MTKAEHKKRMAARAEKRASQHAGWTPVNGKRCDALKARYALIHGTRNTPLFPDIIRHNALRYAVPASINRRTMKPHEHKREIARNLRKAGAA